jgi:germination protein M
MARRVMVWVLVIIMAAGMLAGCGGKPPVDEQTNTQPQQQDDANTRKTVLYFRDASGYIVPVMKRIPIEEGIAKAALKCLVAGTDEDATLSAMGISAPIPAGTNIDLDIASGRATVNLKMAQKCEDKASEEALLASVVNTLLEFATVNKVAVQINGQVVKAMPNGAAVKEIYDAQVLNIEPVGAPGSMDGKLELCFSNEAGRLLVPVYRVAGENVSLANTLSEMMQPAGDTGLVSVFPPSCDVLGVTVSDDGTATMEFSQEFASISDTPSMEAMALRAIGTICKQFHGVKDFKIIAGGKEFEPTVSTASMAGGSGYEYLNYYN